MNELFFVRVFAYSVTPLLLATAHMLLDRPALGLLGIMAISRRNRFRIATILATPILGVGATSVHIWDIAATGNLSPGNTIINLRNLLDSVFLIGLIRLASRNANTEATKR